MSKFIKILFLLVTFMFVVNTPNARSDEDEELLKKMDANKKEAEKLLKSLNKTGAVDAAKKLDLNKILKELEKSKEKNKKK